MPIDRVFVLTCETPYGEELFNRPLCFKNSLDAINFVRGLVKEGIIYCESCHYYKDGDYYYWQIKGANADTDNYADFTITETDLI